jgi:hypothetical protein
MYNVYFSHCVYDVYFIYYLLSENDDSELQRALQKKYNQSLAAMKITTTDDANKYNKCSHCPTPAGHVVLDHNQNNNNELTTLPLNALKPVKTMVHSDAQCDNDDE